MAVCSCLLQAIFLASSIYIFISSRSCTGVQQEQAQLLGDRNHTFATTASKRTCWFGNALDTDLHLVQHEVVGGRAYVCVALCVGRREVVVYVPEVVGGWSCR